MEPTRPVVRNRIGYSNVFLRITLLLLSMSLFAPTLFAQDAVPTEILQRTQFIKFGNEMGSAFKVDYQGKIYLVTARHVVAGAPAEGAIIQVWQTDQWVDYKTVKTLYPESSDVDIAVFETTETAFQPFQIVLAGQAETTLGQQVWFLGFPWGLGSRFTNAQLPFIKRGTMSAVDFTNPKAIVIFIDGFNNPGFSGGPIVFYSFSTHRYLILGVVKGYREDTAKVLVNGAHADTQLLVNSGILVAYSAVHVLETIAVSQKQAAK